MTIRTVKTVQSSKPTVEGAGVRLKRAFGFQEAPSLDPFLLLDDFHSDNPDDFRAGFPWHPHRGIETITYLVQGEVRHQDSLGNGGVIRPGEVQWMTAGSGIIHQEMPDEAAGPLWGFQLWANLPASHKMMEPRYRDVNKSQIPEVTPARGVTAKIIAGEIDGTSGPVRDIVTDPEYLHVTLEAGARWEHRIKRGHRAFAYLTHGEGLFEPDTQRAVRAEDLVVFEDGDQVVVTATGGALGFLLVSGSPIGEPVAWYGPIVMNTDQELQRAFDEYRSGTFLKHG